MRIKAEIFWHTSICQKVVDHYKKDLPMQGTKGQFHDLLFTEIGKSLSGNVYIREINKKLAKYKAISYYKKKYYQTYFYLRKRPDCGNTNFILIVSIYRDYDKDDHEKFDEYEKEIQKEFSRTGTQK